MKFILIFMFAFGGCLSTYAGNIVRDTIQVKGNCGMCKERIENAALIKGVKMAKWDAKSLQLIYVYNPEKVDSETVQHAIAMSGHETEMFLANQKTVTNLPDCCVWTKSGGKSCCSSSKHSGCSHD